MPGAWHTRSLVCKGRKHTSSHYRHAETIRHSLRNGFNGLSSRSPRCPGLIATVVLRINGLIVLLMKRPPDRPMVLEVRSRTASSQQGAH
jgi:hypothetical protein